MTGGRKAYYRCCVPKCGQTSTTAPELSFHRIVREPTRREMWLLNMRCSESDLFCSSRICGDHFTFYDYEDFDANRLRKFAVPTLFAWEPLYTCQDVQEAPAITAAAASAAASSAAASASAAIEIPDDEMDEEELEEPTAAEEADDDQQPAAEPIGGEQRPKAAAAAAALRDSERDEYDQLQLLVSVSERLAATQGTIAEELARMRRAQLGQDRLLDALLGAVMRQDFPLAMTEADRAQLLAMRAAATVACASDPAAAAAAAQPPPNSGVTSQQHQHQLRQHHRQLRGGQQRHHHRHQRNHEVAEDDGGDDDYDDGDDVDDANDADYNAEEDEMDNNEDEDEES